MRHQCETEWPRQSIMWTHFTSAFLFIFLYGYAAGRLIHFTRRTQHAENINWIGGFSKEYQWYYKLNHVRQHWIQHLSVAGEFYSASRGPRMFRFLMHSPQTQCLPALRRDIVTRASVATPSLFLIRFPLDHQTLNRVVIAPAEFYSDYLVSHRITPTLDWLTNYANANESNDFVGQTYFCAKTN